AKPRGVAGRAGRLAASFSRPVLQQLAGLALQHPADRLQGREAHALDVALLEQREVGLADADRVSQLLRLHLAPRQHHVEVNHDRHQTMLLASSAVAAASRITWATLYRHRHATRNA